MYNFGHMGRILDQVDFLLRKTKRRVLYLTNNNRIDNFIRVWYCVRHDRYFPTIGKQRELHLR